MMQASSHRAELRQALRARRQSLPSSQLSNAEAQLVQHALPILQRMGVGPGIRVGGYLAIQGEMPIDNLLRTCRELGATTYAPIMNTETHTMRFASFDDNTTVETRRWGIREPDVASSTLLQPMQMHLVLTPLVAFDARGQRMGMGGGFYDRSFATRREQAGPPWLIGVAHAFQEVAAVDVDWWDVALDAVITDHGVHELSLPSSL